MAMKKNNNQSAKIVYCIIVVVIVCMVCNVIYLGATGKHFVSGNDIEEYAESRGESKTDILSAKRGTIYSSDNEVIAGDMKTYKLYAILSKTHLTLDKKPDYVVDPEATAKALAPIIGMDEEDILKQLKKDTYQVEFGSYGNNLSSLVKDQIDALKLPGLEFDEITTRNYRYGDFASYEVGYAQAVTDEIKGKTVQTLVGKMGIEQAFDDELSGTDGERTYLADNNNNVLPNGILSETAPVAGNDVYLTIDTDVQTELDMQMEKMIEELKPEKATCGIMDAKTGKLLAISNYPSFDPNERDIKNYVDLFLNEPVEPGSVFKSFVYGNAINDQKLDVDDTYQSGKFHYKVNGKTVATINDHNSGRGWGTISYKKGFYYSSNTGICHILSEKTDKQSLLQDYEDLGFFKESSIDGLTSAAGFAGYKREGERTLEYLTTGFGQGSTFTALQLIRAYSAFANDGKMVEPYLVEKVVNSDSQETLYEAKTQYSKQIYSVDTVKQVRELLKGVINEKGSTGYNYRMDDVSLIGKTGTGQVASESGGYRSGYYTHSFVGMAPYDDPQVILVMWYQGSSSSTTSAAKVVQGGIRAALNKLNTQPSQVVETSTFVLDNYMNQSVDYAKEVLSNHQLSSLVIGDGDIVMSQYPKAQTEVSSKSRVFLQTNGTNITMPSMTGWSRKEAEAFGTMAHVDIEFKGEGTIYKQSVTKGTKLKSNQKITVTAK